MVHLSSTRIIIVQHQKLHVNVACPQTIPLELPVARRGAEDRPDDGVLRPALLPAQPRHFHQRRHLLRAELRDHNAEHVPPQPKREGQAVARTVRRDESRNQQRRRPTPGIALGTCRNSSSETMR